MQRLRMGCGGNPKIVPLVQTCHSSGRESRVGAVSVSVMPAGAKAQLWAARMHLR